MLSNEWKFYSMGTYIPRTYIIVKSITIMG